MSQVAQVPRQPHIIEAAELPDRYARGWYCLGLASEYTNKPVKLNYFGTRMVAYRGEDGEVHILDGYCPHMGADLSEGCVEENSIRCPFHAWRWGADGVCDDIPYAKRIPAKAVIRSYPTLEENHLLFMWFDPEGNPPIEDQRPPRIDDVYSDDWTIWQMDLMTIQTNARELIDNMADVAHFGPIHGAPIKQFKNIVYKHTYRQELTGGSELLAEDGELSSEATYYGPAYMNTFMTGQVDGMDVASRLLVTHVPIDTHSFDLRFGVAVKKIAGMSDEQNEEMARQYTQQNREAFFQDVHIWHTKTRVDNPVLCDGDGPINRLRQWYQQFYLDIADVPDTFNEKREYVVDYAIRNP
ncbi:3-ketosteroid-9-alpha-monooxygenase, oxygenase component [Zhongshania aliphaticivorans]|uniref:3-ketosteroid-9-alpha-monooxygenase, oxygenase component n=1 Tax=Zhongshania aliphaticivorans TaxID=1470434 RepID=A0A5S9MUF6_9GAMM|nr:Rieske 2Fe-2S domain-containing protein [Zhongshania aliphaticivorans]CAA0079936.1 3-ketosteroid-9-alpha-monooxygenase, oxygenase component [Zhongshania aliphaticivorans]